MPTTRHIRSISQNGLTRLWSSSMIVRFMNMRPSPSPRWVKQLTQQLARYDDELLSHSIRVSTLMQRLAKSLALPNLDQRNLSLAALLHDIGKIHLPAGILNKPGRLTRQEKRMVAQHVRLGFLTVGKYNQAIAELLIGHHEPTVRYPRAPKQRRRYSRGVERRQMNMTINYYHQLLALCDTYDALSSNRSYKSSWTKRAIITELQKLFPNRRVEITLLSKGT